MNPWELMAKTKASPSVSVKGTYPCHLSRSTSPRRGNAYGSSRSGSSGSLAVLSVGSAATVLSGSTGVPSLASLLKGVRYSITRVVAPGSCGRGRGSPGVVHAPAPYAPYARLVYADGLCSLCGSCARELCGEAGTALGAACGVVDLEVAQPWGKLVPRTKMVSCSTVSWILRNCTSAQSHMGHWASGQWCAGDELQWFGMPPLTCRYLSGPSTK